MHRVSQRTALFLALVCLGSSGAACSGGDVASATDPSAEAGDDDSGSSSAGDGGSVDVGSDVDAAVAACADGGTNYSSVVCAANNFLATLTADEKSAVVYDFSDNAAKTVWSNLPGVTRNGMKFGAMSDAQRAAALAVARTVMSDQGYAHLIGVFAGDDYLNSLQSSGSGGGPMGSGGGSAYSSDNYSIAFIGTPSTTSDWMLQIGGHHMAYNVTYRSGTGYPTPHHLGVEPKASFTVSGNYAGTYQPLNDRGTTMFGVFTGLSDADKTSAFLGGTFSDVLLGPVEYGTGSLAKVVYPTQQGVLVSSLSTTQQAAVTSAIESYVNDYDASISAALLADYTSSEAYAQTYLAYSAPTEGTIDPDVNTTYLRIDGPRLWLELSCQAGVVISGISHFHTIYRDKTEDYGASL